MDSKIGPAIFHHISFPVRDMENSLEFYSAQLGMEIRSRSTYDMSQLETVEPGAEWRGDSDIWSTGILEIAALELRGARVQLVKYLGPVPGPHPLIDSPQEGACHVAIRVDNIAEVRRRLEVAGVRFITPLLKFPQIGERPWTWCRCEDPDGRPVELVEELPANFHLESMAERMRGTRIARGLTLKELAKESEISVAHLSQVERGEAFPSIPVLLAVSSALGVSPDYFFRASPDDRRPDAEAANNGRISSVEVAPGSLDRSRAHASLELQDKIAIVTGASSGLGRAIAKELAAHGAKVVCSDLIEEGNASGLRDDDGLPTALEITRKGGEAVFVCADVTKSDQVKQLLQFAINKYARLDIMVNNAGIFAKSGRIHEIAETDYDRVMAVNAKGVWNGCQLACTQFLAQGNGGKIINIASIGGMVGLAEEPDYCASKGAVANLTRQVAIDYARDRISVNAICPGFVRTGMTNPNATQEECDQMVTSMTPLGCYCPAEDIGKLAAFLASSAADYITGAIIPIDGGWTAR